MKKVAVFLYEGVLTDQTTDLCLLFAKRKIHVDLFLYDVATKQLFTKDLQNDYIQVHSFQNNSFFKKLYYARYINRLFQLIYFPPVLYKDKVEEAAQLLKNSNHDYFIGIEKKGLIWAEAIRNKLQTNKKLIYYSLELYIEDYGAEINKFYYNRFDEVRRLEKRIYKNCFALIIQDKLRSKILDKYNDYEHTKIIYFPISVSNSSYPIRTKKYFHEKFSLPKKYKIILLFGRLDRYTSDMTAFSHELIKQNYMLVFHGFGLPAEVRQTIQEKKLPIIISEELVENNRIGELVASAHIGLSLYSNENYNNRLTAFSSNKVAYFTQQGVPIISFKNESYDLLFNRFKCGESIKSMTEFISALKTIDSEYESYCKNSLSAYETYFNLDTNFDTLLNSL